jgi:hypothetical protein
MRRSPMLMVTGPWPVSVGVREGRAEGPLRPGQAFNPGFETHSRHLEDHCAHA